MTHGACASGDPHSAQAGAQMLSDGGNAVDAAVAAALVACVTLPTMTGLAGAGLATVRFDGKVHVLDFFANVSGLGGLPPGPREPTEVMIPFEGIPLPFHVGAPTIAVPGTVAGLWALHDRFGKLPMASVAAPAIHHARDGFECTTAQSRAFRLLARIFKLDDEAWATVANGEQTVTPGETLRNPPLADVLDTLVVDGPAAFYEGEIAHAIVAAGQGWITKEDLASYHTRWVPTLQAKYRGWTLHLPGAPCVTSGMTIASFGALSQGPPIQRSMDVDDWQRLADAMAVGEAVRTDEYEQRLFEKGYLEEIVAACPGGSTMQVSAADVDGNVVSYTTSLGESAGIAAKGTGIVLNNFLGEEDILPSGESNAVGHRMMTSMCPTVALKGDTGLALGAAGSSRIRTAILQTLVHRIDRRRPLEEAVHAPRIHMEAGTLYVEGFGRPQSEVDALLALQKPSKETQGPGFYFGGVQAVEVGPKTIDAAADTPRRGCAAYVV